MCLTADATSGKTGYQSLADAVVDGISSGSKNVCVRLSSAVAGISHDGCHRKPPLSRPCHN